MKTLSNSKPAVGQACLIRQYLPNDHKARRPTIRTWNGNGWEPHTASPEVTTSIWGDPRDRWNIASKRRCRQYGIFLASEPARPHQTKD